MFETSLALATALENARVSQGVLENRTWLIAILTAMRDAVIVTDFVGRVQLLNPAAEKTTGWLQGDAIGQAIDLVYPVLDLDHQPLPASLFNRASAPGGTEHRNRLLLSSKHGREIPIEDSAAAIHNPQGAFIGAVIVFFDITERLRIENLQQQEQQRLKPQIASTKQALAAARSELRSLANRLLTAQEEERRHLARELHDDASQRLALFAMECQRLLLQPASEEICAGLQRLRGQADLLSSTLRDLSHRLHPSELEHLGLPSALRSLVEQYHQNGLDVSFYLHNLTAPVPLEPATALYRIAQEALHNVLKHAPGAAAQVELTQEQNHLHLIVQDSGPGFTLEQAQISGGLGLLSIRERADSIGATFSATTEHGQGVTLRVVVPLADAI